MDGWGAEVLEEPKEKPLSERAVMEQLEAQLKPIFKDLPNEIPLLLFTQPGKNDLFSSATRFLIRAVRDVTPKITLREFDLGHKTARQWSVIVLRPCSWTLNVTASAGSALPSARRREPLWRPFS
jgi:hypothetical protein